MGYPTTIDWAHWKAPTIAPLMKAIVHFESGSKEYLPKDIESISFSGQSFASNYICFGPPVPTSGTISFIDYEQKLNPTKNAELVSGTKIEVFLGLGAECFDPSELYAGNLTNLVMSISASLWTTYNGAEVFATPFKTSTVLDFKKKYLLRVEYTLNDGSKTLEERAGIGYDIFIPLESWPESKTFAITTLPDAVVSAVFIAEIQDKWQPYGVFYTEEWSYNSEGGTAKVTFIDGINDLLLDDNRIDSLVPSKHVDAKTFLQSLLNCTYASMLSYASINANLVYSFYEETQAQTINELCIALASNLFCLPDGSLALTQYSGLYNTGITISDEDVESWSIQQTSAISSDYSKVAAMLPSLVNTDILCSFSDLSMSNLTGAEYVDLPYSSGKRVFEVDYIATVTDPSTQSPVVVFFSWDVANVHIIKASSVLAADYKVAITLKEFKVYGTSVAFSEKPCYNISGTLPYTIDGNPYIQSEAQAKSIVNILDDYLAKPFNVITFTIRGCYGLWMGAKIHVYSERYEIDADYVIISLSLSYNGAVSTTITAQRY